MKITGFEKLRRATSWIISVLAIGLILVSEPPDGRRLFYETLKLTGYGLIVLATLGRIWCAVYIGGRKDQELTIDGPYSICRNPLYVFSFLGVIGVLFSAKNLPLLLIIIPVFWGYYFFVITSEEGRLKELFGKEFNNYARNVNRLVPRLQSYWTRSKIEVNPKIIFHAMLDAMWFMWAFMGLEVVEYLKTPGLHAKSIIPVLWKLPF